jgi:hypothetical protein
VEPHCDRPSAQRRARSATDVCQSRCAVVRSDRNLSSIAVLVPVKASRSRLACHIRPRISRWRRDTDLHEAETREQFKSLLDWTKNSHLHLDLDVSTRATGRVETEQDEPLLLLPDYIAGVYHHADPRVDGYFV